MESKTYGISGLPNYRLGSTHGRLLWAMMQLLHVCLPDTWTHLQLRMFLGGEGGTGKSGVIDAIEAFCCSWSHRSSIIKTALTGKATTIIGGQPLASFLLSLEKGLSAIGVESVDLVVFQ